MLPEHNLESLHFHQQHLGECRFFFFKGNLKMRLFFMAPRIHR